MYARETVHSKLYHFLLHLEGSVSKQNKLANIYVIASVKISIRSIQDLYSKSIQLLSINSYGLLQRLLNFFPWDSFPFLWELFMLIKSVTLTVDP